MLISNNRFLTFHDTLKPDHFRLVRKGADRCCCILEIEYLCISVIRILLFQRCSIPFIFLGNRIVQSHSFSHQMLHTPHSSYHENMTARRAQCHCVRREYMFFHRISPESHPADYKFSAPAAASIRRPRGLLRSIPLLF